MNVSADAANMQPSDALQFVPLSKLNVTMNEIVVTKPLIVPFVYVHQHYGARLMDVYLNDHLLCSVEPVYNEHLVSFANTSAYTSLY